MNVRILITGFGPFPGVPFNPSAVLVKALARRQRPALAGTVRTTHIFATTYEGGDRDLPKLFAQKPDIVLMFGLAGSRRHLCIETRARNAVSLLFPDASRHRAERGIIVPGGRRALRGSAPFADLLGALRNSAIPSRLSRDAGRYLCNYSYWRGLERADGGDPLVQFVHIPPVRFDSRRRQSRSVSFRLLVTAVERLLLALIAARRRQSPR